VNPSPVLILTAAFGDGHNAAARGLAGAIELRGGTAVLEVWPARLNFVAEQPWLRIPSPNPALN